MIAYTKEPGDYTLLVFADIHEHGVEEPEFEAFMAQAIATADPDLIILLGDQFGRASSQSEEAARAGITRILRPVIAANKKFSLVYGNHDIGDSYGKINKTDVLQWYKEIGGGNFAEPDSTLVSDETGVTNFQFRVRDANDKQFANVFLFDAGARSEGQGSYEYVRTGQIEWFKRQNETDNKVPALVFQHVVVPEVYETIYPEAPRAGKKTSAHLGKHYRNRPRFSAFKGIIAEPPCPPDYTDGEFDALAEAGNVMAEINGHDHFNNFTANRRGVDIVSLSTSGWSGPNGIEPYRGAHIITLNPNKPGTYTNMLYTYKQAKKDGAPLTRTRPKKEFWIVLFVYYFEIIWHGIVDFLGLFGVKL